MKSLKKRAVWIMALAVLLIACFPLMAFASRGRVCT